MFTAMLDHAYRVELDTVEALDLVITIYHAVHHYIRMQAVQPEIIAIIARLREMAIPVIALTARGPGMKQQQKRN